METKSLKDYFGLIKFRPGMYLGEKSISKLYDHLQGYKMGFYINNPENSIDKDFFDNFNDFVCDYYDVEFRCDWKSIILEQSHNNEDFALSTFFELFDIFTGKVSEGIYNSKKIALSIFDEFIFNQDKMKSLFGDRFQIVFKEIIDLFKGSLNNLKSDYDFICEKLKEENPELSQIIFEFETKHKDIE